MPLTYTTPPSLGAIASSVVNFVSFDLNSGTATFGVAHYDAGGNVLTTESIVAPAPGAIPTVKNFAYNKLIALRGAGTIT